MACIAPQWLHPLLALNQACTQTSRYDVLAWSRDILLSTATQPYATPHVGVYPAHLQAGNTSHKYEHAACHKYFTGAFIPIYILSITLLRNQSANVTYLDTSFDVLTWHNGPRQFSLNANTLVLGNIPLKSNSPDLPGRNKESYKGRSYQSSTNCSR